MSKVSRPMHKGRVIFHMDQKSAPYTQELMVYNKLPVHTNLFKDDDKKAKNTVALSICRHLDWMCFSVHCK